MKDVELYVKLNGNSKSELPKVIENPIPVNEA